MAYTKTNWVDGVTPLSAGNMNKIENKLSSLDTEKANAGDVTTGLDGKVDKVAGKGLSTEDYTTTEKNKLAGIEAGAEVNTVNTVAGKTGNVTVTKTDVGLGSVANYGVASQSEAEAGTSDAKYMTPLKTKQAVAENVGFEKPVLLKTGYFTTTPVNIIPYFTYDKILIIVDNPSVINFYNGTSSTRDGACGISQDSSPGSTGDIQIQIVQYNVGAGASGSIPSGRASIEFHKNRLYGHGNGGFYPFYLYDGKSFNTTDPLYIYKYEEGYLSNFPSNISYKIYGINYTL